MSNGKEIFGNGSLCTRILCWSVSRLGSEHSHTGGEQADDLSNQYYTVPLNIYDVYRNVSL